MHKVIRDMEASVVEGEDQPLISCPKAYLESLKSFYASQEPVKHPTEECIEKHLLSLICDYVDDLSLQDRCCILAVGSGNGSNDLLFIEMLSNLRREIDNKWQVFQRSIEPDEKMLELFRARAEDLPELLTSRADIEFEWRLMTFQKYVEQKKKDNVKFEVVHFLHSLYYVGLETSLEHCYEKELGEKGVIVCAFADKKSAFVRYGQEFSSQGLILNAETYYSSKEVKDVAEKNGWKYAECPGETRMCDITAIFDRSSVKGNRLLDFLTSRLNVAETVSQENLQIILDFWENECFEDCHGRKIVTMRMVTVFIFKGF